MTIMEQTAFNALYYCASEKTAVRFSVSKLAEITVEGLPQGRLSIALSRCQLSLIGDPAVTLQISWQDGAGLQALLCREPALPALLLSLSLLPAMREQLLRLQRQQRRNGRREKHRVPFYLAAACLSLLLAYIGIDSSAPLVADKVPFSWEQKIGKYASENYKLGKNLIEDETVNQAVDSVLQRIDQFDDADIEYQLTIIEEDMINAFAFPGGYVVVTSALIEQSDNPEQVAAVLAHEVTHVLQHHSMRKLVRQAGVGVILGIVFGDASALSRLVELSAKLHSLAFDRDQEREADDGAIKILTAAEIAPSNLAAFFEKIKHVEGASGNVPALLRTHPMTDERIGHVSAAEQPAEPYRFPLDWAGVKQKVAMSEPLVAKRKPARKR